MKIILIISYFVFMTIFTIGIINDTYMLSFQRYYAEAALFVISTPLFCVIYSGLD